ncbi:hypothetical protein BGZ94_000721 [Podila epigama]|nr:hypothetical protein BGZ94_000721 [Podila epigama]
MDRFKAIRSDTIPLKTFTYHETPVVDRPRILLMPIVLPRKCGSRLDNNNNNNRLETVEKNKNGSKGIKTKEGTCSSDREPPLLPRHLLARETRSNSDYLRMMAAELRMIRSRKLISPLKPRGYLPRRKDPFRTVRSSLCNSLALPKEEDDHPLNNILVGSWSSVSSSDSYLSEGSSGYQTANECFY